MIGSSLSEVLIALFFSSFIMSIMGQAYLSVKTHYQWQEKQFEEAHQALLLTGWLKMQIQSAGNFGCNHQSALTFDSNSPSYLSNSVWLLKPGSAYLPNAVKRKAVPGSDILMLSQLAQPLNVVLKTQANSELIAFVKPTTLKAGQKVVISDCQYASLAVIKSVSPSKQKASLVSPLLRAYDQNATISALELSIVYLRKVKKGRALFVSNGKRSEELDPNVVGMTLSKQHNDGRSLLHVQLKRDKGRPWDFYAGVIG